MKKMKLFAILLVFIPACALFSPRGSQTVAVNQNDVGSDSTEYGLVVFDQGFETWLLMQPAREYSLEYYKSKNRFYVSEWNYRYMNPRRYKDLYGSYIDYDPLIDYGLEFERRLFYYFKYFEETNGVRLDPGSR
ncbi:MAG: DUF6146 family protein [Bacteroidales bacterium]|jgi:hypothetical protein|nr:DUF6146 family protein [Bacteroidales bacterium]